MASVQSKTTLHNSLFSFVQEAFRNDSYSPHLQQFDYFYLKIKQLLTQHIPFLGFTQMLTSWELLEDFKNQSLQVL